MAYPFGKAPIWSKVFHLIEEFGGSVSTSTIECKGMPTIYKFSRNGKDLYFPIDDLTEPLTPSVVENLSRQLGIPLDAFGEHYSE